MQHKDTGAAAPILGLVAKQTAPITDNRVERLLAYMVAAMILLSIAAFFAIVIATWVGAGINNGFGRGIWPTVFVLPAIGLPLGFILLIVLLVLNGLRRSREARADRASGK